MRLTWKDGLATVFVGAAVLLYLLSPSDIWLFGLSGSRGLAVAIFALGVGGCYTTLSQSFIPRQTPNYVSYAYQGPGNRTSFGDSTGDPGCGVEDGP